MAPAATGAKNRSNRGMALARTAEGQLESSRRWIINQPERPPCSAPNRPQSGLCGAEQRMVLLLALNRRKQQRKQQTHGIWPVHTQYIQEQYLCRQDLIEVSRLVSYQSGRSSSSSIARARITKHEARVRWRMTCAPPCLPSCPPAGLPAALPTSARCLDVRPWPPSRGPRGAGRGTRPWWPPPGNVSRSPPPSSSR